MTSVPQAYQSKDPQVQALVNLQDEVNREGRESAGPFTVWHEVRALLRAFMGGWKTAPKPSGDTGNGSVAHSR